MNQIFELILEQCVANYYGNNMIVKQFLNFPQLNTGLKLGKVVYVITPHLHTKFQISTLLLCQNIPVDVIFYVKT